MLLPVVLLFGGSPRWTVALLHIFEAREAPLLKDSQLLERGPHTQKKILSDVLFNGE